jgi:phosphate transport system protein
MPRTEYTEQLAALRRDVVAMGELVLERYEEALEAREGRDAALAERVIEGDREVNERYLAVERDCIDLFALEQPVAGDLRLVASSFKIATDLERVGDLATNLAADAEAPPGESFPSADVGALASEAGDMLADALDAYATDDEAACWAVAERDDDLDAACEAAGEAVVTELIRAGPAVEAEPLLEATKRRLLSIRDVERVGDHAVNVAARTLYMTDHDDSLLF